MAHTMRIFFGADRNGSDQATALIAAVTKKGECHDVVARDSTLDDYIKIAHTVSRFVRRHKTIGILLCGTGAGTAIVANKHKGIYAVTCFDPTQARDAKRINNANVLCLAATTSTEVNVACIVAFLSTHYRNRKPHRIKAVRALERLLLK